MLFTAIGTALGATAASATAVGIGASTIAAGSVGYSMYSANQQAKALKSAASARDGASMPTAPVKPDTKDSAAIAQQSATDKSRAMARSKSVMTNPLGIKDEATVARKKLLGG